MYHQRIVRASAVTFTGGQNRLELQSGWSLTGNVVGQPGDDNTLILGGDTTTDGGDGTATNTTLSGILTGAGSWLSKTPTR